MNSDQLTAMLTTGSRQSGVYGFEWLVSTLCSDGRGKGTDIRVIHVQGLELFPRRDYTIIISYAPLNRDAK